jgi:hypothetical protein
VIVWTRTCRPALWRVVVTVLAGLAAGAGLLAVLLAIGP